MRELLGADAIRARVHELGAAITADFAESRDLLLLGVLKGSFIFLADLARAIDLPLRIEFVAARSYDGTTGGELEIDDPVGLELKGADIIIVEDIVERGATIDGIIRLAENLGAASITVCALLRKPLAPAGLAVRYTGFEIPSAFVVGYGLDFNGNYRNLPGVMVFED